jgi:predicted  nucleic acid-binding Zn-ribbon protein
MNEKPNYPFLFGLVILAFWSGWYISERGNTTRIADLRNTTEQLNNQNRELTNSLDEIQGKLGEYEELIKVQRERLESLYSDLAGGLEESTSLASGATEDLRDAQGTVERIRKLLDSP